MNKKLDNLLVGLENFKKQIEKINTLNLNELVKLHSNLEILIFQAKQENHWNEIVYPCQEMQRKIIMVIETY